MKNIAIILVSFVLCAGCQSEEALPYLGEEACSEGQTQCSEDMAQICPYGEWRDFEDCWAQGQICAMVQGQAECVDAVDTELPVDGGADGDSDSDTDVDSDSDTDGGFGTPCFTDESCLGLEADFCVVNPLDPDGSPGYCSIQNCNMEESCPMDWKCCDCTALSWVEACMDAPTADQVEEMGCVCN